MGVCVRVDDELVAEPRNITDAVQKPNAKTVSVAPVAQSWVGAPDVWCAETGVATPATLAELQARSDEAAAAGCRGA